MNALASKRVLAFLVDLLVYVALWIFFFFNFQLNDYFSWLIASSYILVKDGMIHGQSLGKMLLRLRVIDAIDKEPISFMSSIERNAIFVVPNLLRFIPFLGTILLIAVFLWETYQIYSQEDGSRWGDQFAKTEVTQL